VESLVQLCSRNWDEGNAILRDLMGRPAGPLRKVVGLPVRILKRLVTSKRALDALSAWRSVRGAVLEAASRVPGSGPEDLLLAALRDKSPYFRRLAIELVGRRWSESPALDRERFLGKLAEALALPKTGVLGVLWHCVRKGALLSSGTQVLFACFVRHPADDERTRQIVECCKRILRDVPPEVLPRIGRRLVGPAMIVIRLFSQLGIKPLVAVWDEDKIEDAAELGAFLDPNRMPDADQVDRIVRLYVGGGRDRQFFGLRWLASMAMIPYLAKDPEHAVPRIRDLVFGEADEYSLYWILSPLMTAWFTSRDPDRGQHGDPRIAALAEEVAKDIVMNHQETMYLPEKPWFTGGTRILPLAYASRIPAAAAPFSPVPIVERMLRVFFVERDDPVMTDRILMDIGGAVQAYPHAMLPTLFSFRRLFELDTFSGSRKKWQGVHLRLCSILATLRLTHPTELAGFFDDLQPPPAFVDRVRRTVPDTRLLQISSNLRVGGCANQVFVARPALGEWLGRRTSSLANARNLREYLVESMTVMLESLQSGELTTAPADDPSSTGES